MESQINALNYPSALTWSKRLFHLETHRSGLKECPAETRDILISLLGASSATESHAISTCQECKSCLSFQEPPIYKCSLVVKITGGVRSVTTSRVFLAHHLALPEKEGTTSCGQYQWANFSHAITAFTLSLNRCVLLTRLMRVSSEHAVAPKEQGLGITPCSPPHNAIISDKPYS